MTVSNACLPRLKAAGTRRGSAVQAPACEFGEEALDGVEPGCGGGVKWKVQHGWRASHARTFGIVVDDGVARECGQRARNVG